MNRIIATLETATPALLRIVYNDELREYQAYKFNSRAAENWVPIISFEHLEEAIAWLSDQCHDAAESIVPMIRFCPKKSDPTCALCESGEEPGHEH